MTDSNRQSSEEKGDTQAFHDQATQVDGKSLRRESTLKALSVPRLLATKASEPDARYDLQELLGEGVSGRVYLARDKDLGREIAIKVIANPTSDERELFLHEARVSAALGHPNIPPLYDAGETSSGTLYLSMCRAPGRTLGKLVRKAAAEQLTEAMPVSDVVEVMLKLCDAVAYVHSKGVVHQDIKPDNIVLGDYGEVMLVDWGAAAINGGGSGKQGTLIGTPAYMAPERLRGDAPNPSFDIYALGATLFHVVLLRKPLVEQSESRFWHRKRAGELDPPTAEELLRVQRPLLGIALKAMSAEPRDRYQTVADLAQALRDFQAGRSAWSAPIVVETFADDSYLERWQCVAPNQFRRENGRIVSECERGGFLVYRRRLAAGIAIEFEGEILEGHAPGDLSVMWTAENPCEPEPHWPKSESVWCLQVAAYCNLMVGIFRGNTHCVAGHPRSIETGKNTPSARRLTKGTFAYSSTGSELLSTKTCSLFNRAT